MTNKTVSIKIFTDNTDVCKETYECKLSEKIIDIKNKILKNLFNGKFNYLDLENITERVYKDYGKLFFDIGVLPVTIDNYRLSEFTIENRTFLFKAVPSNVEIKKVVKHNTGILKKIIKGDSNDFVYDKDDFPPLV